MSRPADMEAVERVLRETGVDQQVPTQGWSGYPIAVAEAVLEAIGGLRAPRGLETLPGILGPAAAVIVGVTVLTLLLAFARFSYRRWQDRRRKRLSEAGPARAATVPAAAPREGAGWRAEIERRLSQGDLPGALEAVWWWFAVGVSDGDVDPSWTSRELLTRSGRLDLAPLGSTLDRLLYGARRPDAEDVRRFVSRGEAALS